VAEVLFFIAGIGAIAGAIGVVRLRNPFYSVLALVFHLLSLAALFLLLRAEFLAAAQVIIYAGAVMVLYVFVVAYVGAADEPIAGPDPAGSLRLVGPVIGVLLFAELCIATLGSGLQALGDDGAGYDQGFGSPERIGRLLLTKFLLPFEVASFLLLIAAVGAVILARRRRGLEGGDDTEQLLTVVTAPEIGTMAEAAGLKRGAP
jgi:NADH-quinone oxidoreductase subunit J